MFNLHLLLLLTIYTSLPFVCADYIIDDSNYSTLKFSENPAGPVWGPFGADSGEQMSIRLPNGTMMAIPDTDCYDNTYTYAACSASNNCAVQFSFSGSGITIYVLQAGPQGMSASLSIDSGPATTATLGAPPAPQYYIPRVTLFNVQNLPSGTHSVVMTVLDWNGGFSGMMLDYIAINQAVVAPPPGPSPSPSPSPNLSPSPSPAPSPTPSPTPANLQTTSQSQTSAASSASVSNSTISSVPTASSVPAQTSLTPLPTTSGNSTTVFSSSSSPHKNNVAAIAGGVAGGVVGLLALLLLALFCLRRRRRPQIDLLNETPGPLPVEARFTYTDTVSGTPLASYTTLSPHHLSGGPRPLQSWTESDSGSTSNLLSPSMLSPMTNSSHMSGNESSSVPVSPGVSSSLDDGVASDWGTPLSAQFAQPGLLPQPTPPRNEKAIYSLNRAPEPPVPQSPPASQNPVLTDQQADFVNSLFNNRVPAPVVARVLERMLANPHGAGFTGYDDPELRAHLDELEDGETTLGTAPPSYYDFVHPL